MPMPLKWEFPGGKVEAGETEKEALIREICEELEMTIVPEKRMQPVYHRYETTSIYLVPYLARVGNEFPQLTEHRAFRWMPLKRLWELDWAEADLPVVQQIQRGGFGFFGEKSVPF
jgi:8-oxo-dGTP diphosphatase